MVSSTPKDFKTVFMMGKFDGYVHTVTFKEKESKLNSRHVLFLQPYGTVAIS